MSTIARTRSWRLAGTAVIAMLMSCFSAASVSAAPSTLVSSSLTGKRPRLAGNGAFGCSDIGRALNRCSRSSPATSTAAPTPASARLPRLGAFSGHTRLCGRFARGSSFR